MMYATYFLTKIKYLINFFLVRRFHSLDSTFCLFYLYTSISAKAHKNTNKNMRGFILMSVM